MAQRVSVRLSGNFYFRFTYIKCYVAGTHTHTHGDVLDQFLQQFIIVLLQTELLRTDQQGFLKELDENLLSRQPSESSIPIKRWHRCVKCCHACCLYRAAFGFTCTISLFVLGLVLLMVAEVAFNDDKLLNKHFLTASGFFIAMGFFGTFSGITNLLANVALFYGIPYLPGIGSVAVVAVV